MSVTVVAEIGILPEKKDEALGVLKELCEQTHAKDEGCELYAVQIDPEDDSHLWVVEKWASLEALGAHNEADHLKAAVTSGVLSGEPRITVLEPAGFGDPEKGSL